MTAPGSEGGDPPLSPQTGVLASDPPSAPSSTPSNAPSSSDMLFYYQHLLPFKSIFQWLSHLPKPTPDFTMREFAYEFRSGAYQRYNLYASAEEFKEAVCRANPTRFEVGAVYAVNPKLRKTLPKSAMKPVSKELVFDIDLTDYDEIRTCCSKTEICEKCWKFVTVAAGVMDAVLREDFGFRHMVWVFSGRRGAHCWVLDALARLMLELERRAVVEYMDVLRTKTNKKVQIRRPMHPLVARAYTLLERRFVEIILDEQDPWHLPERARELLEFMPDQRLADELTKLWGGEARLLKQRWGDIAAVGKKVMPKQMEQVNDARKDIIIATMYPRLDIEVLRQVIHLLKSPFCIHPSTGNVCVPFDPVNGDFHPTLAPNLRQLQHELETHSGGKRGAEWELTSLKPYVELFQLFVKGVVDEELRGSKRAADTLDF